VHARRSFLLAAAAAVALVACSDSSSNPGTTSTTVVSASTTTQAAGDDGVLRIGAVIPGGGAAADMGVSMRAALTLATNEINAAGGVNGRSISITIRDEGDSAATALAAVQDLVHNRSDVVIGPTSSLNLLATLSAAVTQNVLTCSPTGSALALDDFPANGLLVRTIPSDSLQAQAIARTVDQTGRQTAVVAYLDDAYGRPLADAVTTALEQQNTGVSGSFRFQADSTPDSAEITKIAALQPDVVVVVADGVTGPGIVTAVADALPNRLPTFVVNDAMRRPDAATAPYSKDVAAQIVGVSPLAYSDDADFVTRLQTVDPAAGGLYAANAYDCVNLVAIAADTTGTDSARVMAATIPQVSSGGSSCATFEECMRIADEGRNPNYDGPNGVLAVGSQGATTSAKFEQFRIDPDTGRDVRRGVIGVGNP
jgi:branched-chain amino acid transport system substrate-binding protein